MSQLWYNSSLMDFFFRRQARATLELLIEEASGYSTTKILNEIDYYADQCGLDVDELEEMFYEFSVQELAAEFGIELDDEYEEDEQ